jgi:D-lyxose ketol-isomerase
MKRSEVNRYICEANSFFREHNFALPPFADWTPKDWESLGPEVDEIRLRKLGWDVTDFNTGNFEETGLIAFTLRNGRYADPKDHRSYAEKILLIRQNQVTPLHRHFVKTEDIINRNGTSGGFLVLQLYNAGPEDSLARTPVWVLSDGVARSIPAGTDVALRRGESITITPGIYHSFYASGGPALVGEVSSVNDDDTDNHFHTALSRYSSIQQDEPPFRLLCTEYPKAPREVRVD